MAFVLYLIELAGTLTNATMEIRLRSLMRIIL